MASSSPSVSPSHCSVCEMFSYFSASFSENGKCRKWSLFVTLEVRLSELKTRFRQLDHSPVGAISSQADIVAGQPGVGAAAAGGSPAAPEQPASQGDWVTVWSKTKACGSPPLASRI